MHRRLITLALAASLAACASPDRGAGPTCAAGLENWTMTELYFGLTWSQGAITEAEWQDFVAAEIVPRFPEGVTIVPAEGAWRSTRTGQTIRQPSRVLLRLRKDEPAQETAIAGVIAAYKSRFQQQSVLRVDAPVCAAF